MSLALNVWACISLLLVCMFKSNGSIYHFLLGDIVIIMLLYIIQPNNLLLIFTIPSSSSISNSEFALLILNNIQRVLLSKSN